MFFIPHPATIPAVNIELAAWLPGYGHLATYPPGYLRTWIGCWVLVCSRWWVLGAGGWALGTKYWVLTLGALGALRVPLIRSFIFMFNLQVCSFQSVLTMASLPWT